LLRDTHKPWLERQVQETERLADLLSNRREMKGVFALLLRALVIGGIVWGVAASLVLLGHQLIHPYNQLANYQLVVCLICLVWYLLIAAITESIVLLEDEQYSVEEKTA
jgi:hypothetical protein